MIIVQARTTGTPYSYPRLDRRVSFELSGGPDSFRPGQAIAPAEIAAVVPALANERPVMVASPAVPTSDRLQAPISREAQGQMESVSKPSPTDNNTARSVRERYGVLTGKAIQESKRFADTRSLLRDVGHRLDRFADQGPGTYQDGPATVIVTRDAQGTKVLWDSPGGHREMTQDATARHIFERDARTRELGLRESGSEVTVTIDNRTLTVRTTDPSGFTIAEKGVQRQSDLFIGDGTMTLKEAQSISGFAGSFTLVTEERLSVPASSRTPSADDPLLTYTRSEHREGSKLPQKSDAEQKLIEVRQDGSTRTREGSQPDVIEPGMRFYHPPIRRQGA